MRWLIMLGSLILLLSVLFGFCDYIGGLRFGVVW